MTPERVRSILAAHGADPARWPIAERDAVAAALAADPGLARERNDAAALDAALALHPTPPALALNPLAIAARAQAAARRPAASRVARLWPRAAGLAAAGLIGFVVGWSELSQPTAGEREDSLAFLSGVEGDVL